MRRNALKSWKEYPQKYHQKKQGTFVIAGERSDVAKVFGLDRLDTVDAWVDDACMEQSIVVDSEVGGGRAEGRRRWRTVEEMRRIVEEAMAPGASLAQVASLHGGNANQVFLWRRQYQAGELVLPNGDGQKLLPDSVDQKTVEEATESRGGSTHIEFAAFRRPSRSPVMSA